jgi:hypothetical protein
LIKDKYLLEQAINKPSFIFIISQLSSDGSSKSLIIYPHFQFIIAIYFLYDVIANASVSNNSILSNLLIGNVSFFNPSNCFSKIKVLELKILRIPSKQITANYYLFNAIMEVII